MGGSRGGHRRKSWGGVRGVGQGAWGRGWGGGRGVEGVGWRAGRDRCWCGLPRRGVVCVRGCALLVLGHTPSPTPPSPTRDRGADGVLLRGRRGALTSTTTAILSARVFLKADSVEISSRAVASTHAHAANTRKRIPALQQRRRREAKEGSDVCGVRRQRTEHFKNCCRVFCTLLLGG